MARKKKTSKNPTKILVGVIILLVLGFAGINAPESLYEFFGLTSLIEEVQTPVSEKNNPGVEDLGKSSFTTEQLQDQAAFIEYEELDSLKRPQGASALLKKNLINTGTSANRDIRPPGFISGEKPYFHSRGHLIGRQLGGSGDDPRNLATLYQNPVNTPYMTTYENQIRQAMEDNLTVFYQVKVEYDGNNLFPKAVVLSAKTLNNPTLDFSVRIYNLQAADSEN
ncbi:DNA/RNA non-specific endonuclease [Enterococcus timonensis]|uniref:DNA/RNA non-specific endonuclease n=1 Tax=Enterococcus timonensis TaxID=1852364 RepID=UPI0008DA6C3A|nr:DNA/RNA non-specific endonuclease [Enterococcus timonensis]